MNKYSDHKTYSYKMTPQVRFSISQDAELGQLAPLAKISL